MYGVVVSTKPEVRLRKVWRLLVGSVSCIESLSIGIEPGEETGVIHLLVYLLNVYTDNLTKGKY